MANSFSGISRPLAFLLITIAIVGAVMFIWPRFTHSISGQKLLDNFVQVQNERAAASQQASDDNQQRAEERQQEEAKAADTGLPRFAPPEPAVGEQQPSGFAQNNAGQQSGSSAPPSNSRNDQQMTPQQIQNNQAQAEMKDLQQQQQIAEQREQLKQQQREAVPSLLTDNPPSPVNLGAKY